MNDLARAEIDDNLRILANHAYHFPVLDGISNEEVIEKYSNSVDRIYFIRFLASMQNPKYLIAPVIEQRGTLREVSFIFTISSSKCLYLVWESCSENRGTHIFRVKRKDFHSGFNILKSYISDRKISGKRKILWQNDYNSLTLKNKIVIINHISIQLGILLLICLRRESEDSVSSDFSFLFNYQNILLISKFISLSLKSSK